MSAIGVGSLPAQSLVTITAPSASTVQSSDPVTVTLTLSSKARPSTLRVRLNGRDVSSRFNICSSTVCTAALTSIDGLAPGSNHLTASVAGTDLTVDATKTNFTFKTGLTSTITSPPSIPAAFISNPKDCYTSVATGKQACYQAIQIGSQIYPRDCDPSAFTMELFSFDRRTLQFRQSACLVSAQDLTNILQLPSLDSSQIVFVFQFAGEPIAPLPKGLDSSAIGGTANLTNLSPANSGYPYNYHIIGVPGAAPGTAYESFNYTGAGNVNALQGALIRDSSDNYAFHPSQYPEFEIIPNNPAAGNQSTLRIGDLGNLPSAAPNPYPLISLASYALPAPYTSNGFWLVTLDRSTLTVLSTTVYNTNNADVSIARQQIQQLAADLNSTSPNSLVILTTVGKPMNWSAGIGLYSAIEALGGPGHTINALKNYLTTSPTANFTLVSTPDPRFPKSSALVSSSTFADQKESGIVRGVFGRDRHTNLFSVVQASKQPVGQAAAAQPVNYDVFRIAWATPVAWPYTDTPGRLAAYAWLSQSLQVSYFGANCPSDPLCPDIRARYASPGTAGQIASGVPLPNQVPFPGNNLGFTQSDFTVVAQQLTDERTALKNVLNFQNNLEIMFNDPQSSFPLLLTSASNEVQGSINAPSTQPVAISAEALNTFAGASTILSLVPDVGPFFGTFAGLLTIAGAQGDSSGNTIPTGTYNTTVGNLTDYLTTYSQQIDSNLADEFDNIYTDWWKLNTVSQLSVDSTNPAWNLSDQQSLLKAAPLLRTGIRTHLYTQFMAALYNSDAAYGAQTPYPYQIGGTIDVSLSGQFIDNECISLYPQKSLASYSWIDYPSLTNDINQVPPGSDVFTIGGARYGSSYLLDPQGESFPSAQLLSTLFAPTTNADGTGSLGLARDQFFASNGVLSRRDWYLPRKNKTDPPPPFCYNSISTEPAPLPGQRSTSLALSSSTLSSLIGSSVTLTAMVNTGQPTPASGVVLFREGTTTLATINLNAAGPAVFSTTKLPLGTHLITAFYQGNSVFAPSTSSTLSILVHDTPDFTIGSPITTLVSDPRGGVATTLTFTPLNTFTGQLTLTCSGAPVNASCTISPSALTLGGTPSYALVTIVTGGTTQAKSTHRGSSNLAIALCTLFSFGLFFRRRRLHTTGLSLLLVFSVSLSALVIAGCSSSPSTPTGNYTITITATGNGITHTQALQLNIR